MHGMLNAAYIYVFIIDDFMSVRAQNNEAGNKSGMNVSPRLFFHTELVNHTHVCAWETDPESVTVVRGTCVAPVHAQAEGRTVPGDWSADALWYDACGNVRRKVKGQQFFPNHTLTEWVPWEDGEGLHLQL